MTLIKSISGIRGTIGGKTGEGLTPVDVVKFTAAFGYRIIKKTPGKTHSIVIGRDARISGPMISQLVKGTLSGLGINVYDAGLATTPTVEMAVVEVKASGGIILTASHNPGQWNAMKLLNDKGEFISDEDGREVLEMAAAENFIFVNAEKLGKELSGPDFLENHISRIIELDLVDADAIKNAGFTIAVDAVNSVGGIAIPQLLQELGVASVIPLYCQPTGIFPHNPEPLPENLTEISKVVKENKVDLAVVVDPDVDRLAVICEDGTMFGEEYTLIAVSDYILSNKKGPVVSNMSSSMALQKVAVSHGCDYHSSPVGEVNVVKQMKACNAVIGGEGNGGVIYPELHYGRDALVGIALFLTKLANTGMKCSELRSTYPSYVISKNKIKLETDIDIDSILETLKKTYKAAETDDRDGLKISWKDCWVHLRKSNTEPIIRIYAESATESHSKSLADKVIQQIKKIL
jgi:phosphomannomutase